MLKANKRRVMAVVVGALALTGCENAVPGHRIEKQSVAVRYADGMVHVRAEYTLRNSGSQPLDSLRISLATVNPGAAFDMRAEVNGAQTKWERVEDGGLPAMELKFAELWKRKQRKRLTLEYSIPSGMRTQQIQSFQLLPGAWSPEVLPPPGLISRGGVAPQKWDLSVTLPEGMLIHATGTSRGAKKRGSEMEHRFQQDREHRMTYVVAGRYHEQRAEANGWKVRFWSVQPVDAKEAGAIAQRLTQTLKLYRDWLGPLDGDAREVWVVDGTAVRYILGGPAGARPGLAPDMIIDPGLGARYGVDVSECVADERLAAMWVGWLARPDRGAGSMSEQLARHVSQSLPHGCGYKLNNAASREDAAVKLRAAFAAAHANHERENGPMKESYRLEREGYRMRLMVLAMEDRAGRDAFHRAVRRVLQALRGEEWRSDDLRSALEGETPMQWAQFFREWGDASKIPAGKE